MSEVVIKLTSTQESCEICLKENEHKPISLGSLKRYLKELKNMSEDDISEMYASVEYIHKVRKQELLDALESSEEDSKKDLAIVYAQTGLKVAKLYAPAVAIGALSIAAILASNNIMRKRNVALAAAYATVDNGFKEYRSRVIERFGKELDQELKFNIKAKEVEETVTNEKGEEETVKKVVHVADPNMYSQFARFFDDGCTGWEKDAELNHMFLMKQQAMANSMLQKRGYVLLNEVYEMLGIPKTSAGQTVGWVYDPKNCDHKGDNFVSFGILDVNKEKARDFVNGYERTILLDFNVDGDIRYLFDTRVIR